MRRPAPQLSPAWEATGASSSPLLPAAAHPAALPALGSAPHPFCGSQLGMVLLKAVVSVRLCQKNTFSNNRQVPLVETVSFSWDMSLVPGEWGLPTSALGTCTGDMSGSRLRPSGCAWVILTPQCSQVSCGCSQPEEQHKLSLGKPEALAAVFHVPAATGSTVVHQLTRTPLPIPCGMGVLKPECRSYSSSCCGNCGHSA